MCVTCPDMCMRACESMKSAGIMSEECAVCSFIHIAFESGPGVNHP